MKIPQLTIANLVWTLAFIVAGWTLAVTMVAAAKAVWSWVLFVPFGYTDLVYETVFGMLASAFQPPPPPPPPKTKMEELKDRWILRAEMMMIFVEDAWEWFALPIEVDTLVIVVIIFIAILNMRSWFTTKVVKTFCAFRGIRFEAMREGSDFSPYGEPVEGQVEILKRGLLSDDHVGYGIRVSDWLVTPHHVIAGMSELMLKGKNPKLVLKPAFIKSRVAPDCVYMKLSDATWSLIGCSKPSISSSANLMVQCAGFLGVSTGILRKSNVRGLVTYGGSTVPGMSGAAYFVGNRIVGMHTGQSVNSNVGISVGVFQSELSVIVTPESSEQEPQYLAGKFIDDSITRKVAAWTEEEILEEAKTNWAKDDFEIDYTRQLEWESLRGSTSKQAVPSTSARVVEVPLSMFNEKATIKVTGQSGDAHEVAYKAEIADSIARKEIEELKLRVTELEGKFKPKKVIEKLKCSDCDVLCNGEIQLANHRSSAHPPLFVCACGKKTKSEATSLLHKAACSFKPESAFPGDTAQTHKVIKEGPFLERGSPSPKMRRRRSPRNSKSRESSPRSRQTEDNQSAILESLNGLSQLLKQALPHMVGRSLDTTQK